MGARKMDKHWRGVLLDLHYALLAGDVGKTIVGVVAFLLLLLSITGIVLWSGWRKLIAGFKIKWNAHPKRVSFDIHKVAGIITAVFLALIAFTGFCWNFSWDEPIIYAVTFTQKRPDPVSKPIPGKPPLSLSEQLKTASAALLDAVIRTIYFPREPEDALSIRMKMPQKAEEYGMSYVYLD